jgi:hypothetical protein
MSTNPKKTADILRRFSELPDSAYVPVPVAAAHDRVSEKTVRRNYQTIPLSPGRLGVNVGWLRSRGKPSAA